MPALPVSLPCRCCGGTGSVPLSGVYLETYMALLDRDDGPSGADLARAMGVKGTAMNMRLAKLEAMGLAEQTRYGRKCLWKARDQS